MRMSADATLVLNAGSSSIKFALYQRGAVRAAQAAMAGQIDGQGAGARFVAHDASGRLFNDTTLAIGAGGHDSTVGRLLDWIDRHFKRFRIAAVGHRVVHGGERYRAPARVDAAVLEYLQSLVPLAPLHQPHNLAVIAEVERRLPGVAQVACFDTAFHRTQPRIEQIFGLPRRFADAGVRRYGFHGLSYEYIACVLPAHLGARAHGRVVVAHLGHGASMCAMAGLRSQATTMGFTAVDGLMMGTRTGAIDPGVLLYLMDNYGMDTAQLSHLLYREAGLLGVSGLSSDMRTLLASREPAAAEAVALFCHRIVRELGALASVLGGLDALVFTGGIGANAAPVREYICRQAQWLGVSLDGGANLRNATVISAVGSRVPVLVLPTDEERMIARHTEDLTGSLTRGSRGRRTPEFLTKEVL